MSKRILRSFAGGEIAPELYGRVDLAKNQTGLKTCENFEVLPHGPVQNRAGLEYVLRTKNGSTEESVLIPFIYNTDQSYVIEFGNLYVRFHTAGATVLNASQNITGITQANPGTLTYSGADPVNGQWMYLSGIVGMTQLNGRFVKVANVNTGANTFDLKDIFSGNNINTTAFTAYTSGGTMEPVYEVVSPYAEADLFDLHFTQANDVLTITHPSYATRELRRSGATSWAFTEPSYDPAQAVPTAVTVTATVGTGSVIYQYKVCALASDGGEESFASMPAITATINITGVTQANPGVVTAVAHGRAAGDPVFVQNVGGMTQLDSEYLVDTAPSADTLTLKTLEGVIVDTTAFTAYTSGGTISFAGVTNNLATAGNKNTIKWTDAAGASRYNVFKYLNGLYGYIGQATTGATGLVDDNITPDISHTPPGQNNPFVGADNYPRAVGYSEGRRWFAGTNNRRQNLWSTRSGTESNMSSTTPTRDDDAIAVRLTARRAETIRHIVPLADLILLTSGGEWRVIAANSDVITPSSIGYKPIDFIGASNVQPVTTSGAVVYNQARGGHFREMRYSWEASNYKTVDISILATHLFDSYSFKSMDYTASPTSIVWSVRSDGTLIGLTYLPDQDVRAWHKHTTDGLFKSVCAVPEGEEDVLYAIVKRTINGTTQRYIERKHTRQFTTLEECFFVDAGSTYDGSAATTISGLWHLIGEEVTALADGSVHPPVTVSATGTITLEAAASLVHVGLGYNADLETLPLALEAQAFGLTDPKNVSETALRVVNSSGVMAGPDFDHLTEAPRRSTETYDSPPSLVNGQVDIVIDSEWDTESTVCVRQSEPLPLTVCALVFDVVKGG